MATELPTCYDDVDSITFSDDVSQSDEALLSIANPTPLRRRSMTVDRLDALLTQPAEQTDISRTLHTVASESNIIVEGVSPNADDVSSVITDKARSFRRTGAVAPNRNGKGIPSSKSQKGDEQQQEASDEVRLAVESIA